MNLSNEIKNIRTKSLLSQEAFAKALGVSFTTVNRWESGKSRPSYKAIKMIKMFCKTNDIPFDATEFVKEDLFRENNTYH